MRPEAPKHPLPFEDAFGAVVADVKQGTAELARQGAAAGRTIAAGVRKIKAFVKP
jgi:hypothetical protein